MKAQQLKYIFIFSVEVISSCNNEHVKKNDTQEMADYEKMRSEESTDDTLNFILYPNNQQVLATIPLTKPEQKTIDPEFNYQGVVSFIPENSALISSKITGRIENIFVKHNYQKINKGQKLFTVYSPELLTEQNNLLFLLKHDANNTTLVEASKNKLRLLGCSENELEQIVSSNRTLQAMTVYSNYNGFITEMNNGSSENFPMSEQNSSSSLSIKKGSYVQKGQSIFSVIDNSKLWVLLSIPVSDLEFIKVGNKLRVKPEADKENSFRAEINYIEPMLDNIKKTVNARVVFDNTAVQLPIASQANALVFGKSITGNWLPSSSVLDLGKHKAVLVKEKLGFKIRIVETSIKYQSLIQIISGIETKDQVALNAHYLMDSESFIKQPNE
jgi:Cu(I)/Ag(I) efflux system membrane fusion protein